MAIQERIDRWAFARLMRLPASAQRRLAGPPFVRQGQTLAPESQLMLRLMRLRREPGMETLPIEVGRRHYRRQARISGGRQPIGSTRHVTVAGRPARLFVPTGASGPGPLVVWFHGGGFVFGDLESHDPACRFLGERADVRVLAVGYRLAPEHPFPAAHDDAVAAHRWVLEHPEEVGADPERIGVGGDSAGGCLAAATAIAAARDGLPLAFQLLAYPATDLRGGSQSRRLYDAGLLLTREYMDLAEASYLARPEQAEDPRASPLLADLPAGLAPAYVATAGFDPLRDEGEAYARRLADAGVPTELRRFRDQLHGFLHLVEAGPAARAANAELAAALHTGLVTAPAAR